MGIFSDVSPSSMRSAAMTCKGMLNKTQFVNLKNNIKNSKLWVDNHKLEILCAMEPNEDYYTQLQDLLDGYAELADMIEEYQSIEEEIDSLTEEMYSCEDFAERSALRDRINALKNQLRQKENSIISYCNSASIDFIVAEKPTYDLDAYALDDRTISDFKEELTSTHTKFKSAMNYFRDSSHLGSIGNSYVRRYANKIKSLFGTMENIYLTVEKLWADFQISLNTANRTINQASGYIRNTDSFDYTEFEEKDGFSETMIEDYTTDLDQTDTDTVVEYSNRTVDDNLETEIDPELDATNADKLKDANDNTNKEELVDEEVITADYDYNSTEINSDGTPSKNIEDEFDGMDQFNVPDRADEMTPGGSQDLQVASLESLLAGSQPVKAVDLDATKKSDDEIRVMDTSIEVNKAPDMEIAKKDTGDLKMSLGIDGYTSKEEKIEEVGTMDGMGTNMAVEDIRSKTTQIEEA